MLVYEANEHQPHHSPYIHATDDSRDRDEYHDEKEKSDDDRDKDGKNDDNDDGEKYTTGGDSSDKAADSEGVGNS